MGAKLAGLHTPGPWTIGRSADNTPLVMVPVHPSEGSGFGVACVNRLPRLGSVRGDMDANARLIACAPDFAAAAEQMMAHEDAGGDGWWIGYEMLKAAYAKALGRALTEEQR